MKNGFLINNNELEALCGLPHIQQLAYLRGIRPYMDVQTGLVGIKRGISYQSIAEQLYIEPHQGIKSESCSRMQVRRALSALERVGLITTQSENLKLILKCELATRGYFVQNKVDLNPTHQVSSGSLSQSLEFSGSLSHELEKADTDKTSKADTPLLKDNYLYLFSYFEKFWSLYPEKKSRQQAWLIFQRLNPDEILFNQMIRSLVEQIKHHDVMQLHGQWLPPWKYPANWLEKRCWEDELTTDKLKESKHAQYRKNHRVEASKDMFWIPDEPRQNESTKDNVIEFKRISSSKENY